jgi:hypothetical protein
MKRRGVLLLAGIATAAAVGGGVWWTRGRSTPAPDAGAPAPVIHDSLRAPPGARVRVQVLNASGIRGLGRRATIILRDRGFDVVEVGNAPERRDSTLVLDRSGHADWAGLVAGALGGAAVEARPDSSRYLDVTVLLGAAWRAPAQSLHP